MSKSEVPSSMIWLGAVGLAGMALQLMMRPKGDVEAFRKKCSDGDTHRKVWDKALVYARRHEKAKLEGLREIGRVLPRAREVLEVLRAIPEIEAMMKDPAESIDAKLMVIRHWAKKWHHALGLSYLGPLDITLSCKLDGNNLIFATGTAQGTVMQ